MRAVGIHGIYIPVTSTIRGEYQSVLALVNLQIRPTVIESTIVIFLAVRQIQGVGAVAVAHVDVPVSVPVAGECQAAAIG